MSNLPKGGVTWELAELAELEPRDRSQILARTLIYLGEISSSRFNVYGIVELSVASKTKQTEFAWRLKSVLVLYTSSENFLKIKMTRTCIVKKCLWKALYER